MVTGRGIAYVQYENANAYAATIAEVEVDKLSGAGVAGLDPGGAR